MASERQLTNVELDGDSSAAHGLREYVRLVATALGLRGQSWLVQLESPVNVYIALDERLRLFPARDVALTWDEEHGWSLCVESNAHEDLVVLSHLGTDVLPAPEAVACAVRSYVDQPSRGQRMTFRSANDHDDLPARLTGYVARPTDLSRRATVP